MYIWIMLQKGNTPEADLISVYKIYIKIDLEIIKKRSADNPFQSAQLKLVKYNYWNIFKINYCERMKTGYIYVFCTNDFYHAKSTELKEMHGH